MEVISGGRVVASQVKIKYRSPLKDGESFAVRVGVYDDMFTCQAVGERLQMKIPAQTVLSAGAIGLKTWGPQPGEAQLRVHSLEVEPIQ